MIDTLGVLTRTVEPTIEPVTLEELTAQVYASTPADDLLLWNYARTARAALEDMYRVAFLTQTWTWKLDSALNGRLWRDDRDEYCLHIPLVPVASVSSITYVDDNGATQTWSSSLYQVQVSPRRRTRIAPAYNETWPSLRGETFGALTVTFVAGWASAAALPLPLKQAVLMYAAFLYANRGDMEAKAELPMAVASLMQSYGLELYV